MDSPVREFSKYQKAIFDWIVDGRGDAVIEAVAGSGKTTTLVECAKLIKSSSVIYLAFNRHIAQELSQRLTAQRVDCRTLHSLGNQVLTNAYGRLRVDDRKYVQLSRDVINKHYREKMTVTNALARTLESLSHYARLTLTPPNNLDQVRKMAHVYNVDVIDAVMSLYSYSDEDLEKEKVKATLRRAANKLMSLLPEVLRAGRAAATDQRLIDYADMLYLPVELDLPCPHYDWVLVDEAQDLSRVQRTLVFMIRAAGGRMIFVGDRHQAIYGFAGADTASFQNIIDQTEATVLPLSVCYRCPASHVKLAKEIVPAIESAPNAHAGTVREIMETDLLADVKEGDLILCRLNAPLVKLCIQLIGNRLPAKMRGRDIGRDLANLALRIDKEFGTISRSMHEAIKAYQDAQIKVLQQREDNEDKIETLRDKCSALEACIEGFRPTSVQDLQERINSLFSDNALSITLSTIHKAKGLEENRVFILRPDKLPMRWKKQTDEAYQQELNLKYVALTRAKSHLTFVKSKDEREKPDDSPLKEEV